MQKLYYSRLNFSNLQISNMAIISLAISMELPSVLMSGSNSLKSFRFLYLFRFYQILFKFENRKGIFPYELGVFWWSRAYFFSNFPRSSLKLFKWLFLAASSLFPLDSWSYNENQTPTFFTKQNYTSSWTVFSELFVEFYSPMGGFPSSDIP